MEYSHTILATFLKRPNRFLAVCMVNGRETLCHIKNTGRCQELLIPGATVILEHAKHPGRKTDFSLIAVYKESMLVNLDSQAPNQAAYEWFLESGFFPGLSRLKREVTHGTSRFDLYAEYGDEKAFLEVKGCTLEKDGTALFPDAPTQRGVRHLMELEECVKEGFQAFLLMIIQMKPVKEFCPNRQTHPQFADALIHASSHGVHLLAFDCRVTPNSMTIDCPVPIHLC